MPGPYNPGQSAIRAVLVNPNGSDVTQLTGAADGSARNSGLNGTSVATASNPLPTASYGAAAIATSQITVGTTNTQIVAARAGRMSVTIENLGTGAFYVGVTGVTVANGYLVPGVLGATVTIPTQAAVFGIAAVAQAVSVLETF